MSRMLEALRQIEAKSPQPQATSGSRAAPAEPPGTTEGAAAEALIAELAASEPAAAEPAADAASRSVRD